MEKYDNLEMNASICKIIKQYLNEEEIEENYQKACKNILSKNVIYDPVLMELVAKECKKMALMKIPKNVFTVGQILFIKNEWGIDLSMIIY